jgi:6-pyruvoyltetrahydropterin/6-carboxytetrahydropterin synthase
MKLTRRYKFSASHRLHSPSLNETVNAEIYGKCNNPYGHGHDYILDVSVRGNVDPQTGRVVSPGELDRYVRDKVISDFDHRDMNQDLPDFTSGLVPTTENVAVVVNDRLRRNWPFEHAELDGVRLEETKRNFFELRNS